MEQAWALHCITTFSYPYNAYVLYEPELTFLRRIDEDHCYAVYAVEGGGRFVLFYRAIDYYIEGETEYINTLMLYITKIYSRSDFDSIRVSDSIDKVIAIDSTAAIKKSASKIMSGVGPSFHYLKDGLLIYKYENRDGQLFVSDIIFSSNYSYNIWDVYIMTDEDYKMRMEYDFNGTTNQVKIFPQDYPQ